MTSLTEQLPKRPVDAHAEIDLTDDDQAILDEVWAELSAGDTGQDSINLSATWQESKHKRGQPKNRGQFGPGGGGAAAPAAGAAPAQAQAQAAPAQPAQQPAAGPQLAPRLQGEPDKAYAKRVIDHVQVQSLPEDAAQYFNVEKAAATVPLDQLVSAKTEEENKQGGANAPARMWAASQGLLSKRDPITVRKIDGGKFQVVDGNGTFTAAKGLGWKSLPVQMEQAPQQTASLFKPDELALPKDTYQPYPPDAGYAGIVEKGKEATQQMQALLDLGKGVGAQLGYATVQPKSDQEMLDLCDKPGGFVVLAPVKGEKRSTEKVQSDYRSDEHPNGDWSKLLDVARASILVDTLADAEKAIEKLRENKTTFARLPKDRMTTPIPPGYRDCLTNIRLPNGIVGELQILCKPMMKAKVEGHKHYEITRSIEAKVKMEGRAKRTPEEDATHKKAMDAMATIYDAAWAKCHQPSQASGAGTGP